MTQSNKSNLKDPDSQKVEVVVQSPKVELIYCFIQAFRMKIVEKYLSRLKIQPGVKIL